MTSHRTPNFGVLRLVGAFSFAKPTGILVILDSKSATAFPRGEVKSGVVYEPMHYGETTDDETDLQN